MKIFGYTFYCIFDTSIENVYNFGVNIRFDKESFYLSLFFLKKELTFGIYK